MKKAVTLLGCMGEGRYVWSHPETLALIDAWEERYDLLRSQRRTAHVHEEIKQSLSALNIDKSIRQIVVKIDNLTQKYRKTKYSGKVNPTWIYYRRLDKFMSYPTRYNRRSEAYFEVNHDVDEAEIVGLNVSENHCSTISISKGHGNDWENQCEADSTQLSSTSGSNELHGGQLLGIISSLIEVQKQSLAVQEKVLDMIKSGFNASDIAQTPKLEIG